MKVEITVCNQTENYICFQEIQEWDNGFCENPTEVYRAALKEYGRCVSKMYFENKTGESKHIGWVFEKKCYYEDTQEPYLQETWITPLLSYEVKHIKEYAMV